MTGWEIVRLEELDSIPLFEGLVWHPVRRRLGIRAFGMNAYTSERAGDTVVEEHDETGGGAGGHEEVYVVLSGRATFTVGGETRDAAAGTFVFVSDPTVKRKAIATEEGTVVLAVGGEPGRGYEISAWEYYFAAMPAVRAERWNEVIALMHEGLEEKPGNPALLYNLACAESRAGLHEDALTHVQQAVAGDAKYAERARDDSDFDPIRTLPGFPA
jgi:hypothetical protein